MADHPETKLATQDAVAQQDAAAVVGKPEVNDAPVPTSRAQTNDTPETIVDSDGVVYRKTPDGLVLEDASESQARAYRVMDGTVGIGNLAFAGNTSLEMIAIPQGVRWIGDSTFSACENLATAVLPDSLERIEDWAFFGSSIESLHIPAACSHIGSCALVADGGGKSEMWTSGRSLNLYEISIDPENACFYLASDVLCARKAAADGGDVAVLYIGPATSVIIPKEVTEIGPMAFANASTLKELVVHGGVKKLGPSALALSEPPRRIVIGLSPTADGHDRLKIEPPRNEAGLNAVNRMFKTDIIDPALIMAEMDRATLNQNDHFARYGTMVDRLADPIFLSPTMRDQFTSFLRNKIWTVCSLFRDRGNTDGIKKLVDTGVLDTETFTKVIDQATDEGDTAMVAQLLQLKRDAEQDDDPFAL